MSYEHTDHKQAAATALRALSDMILRHETEETALAESAEVKAKLDAYEPDRLDMGWLTDRLQQLALDASDVDRNSRKLMEQCLDFVRTVLKEQLAHGEHGDRVYITRAAEILADASRIKGGV